MKGLQMLLPSEYNAWPPRVVNKVSEVNTKCGPVTTELLERKPQAMYLIFFNIIRVLSKSVKKPNQTNTHTFPEQQKRITRNTGSATVKT